MNESSVDVHIPEIGRLSTARHKLVVGVDTLHVVHDACDEHRPSQTRIMRQVGGGLTEVEVGGDPISLVHEFGDCAHEVVNFILGALSAAVEVLNSA